MQNVRVLYALRFSEICITIKFMCVHEHQNWVGCVGHRSIDERGDSTLSLLQKGVFGEDPISSKECPFLSCLQLFNDLDVDMRFSSCFPVSYCSCLYLRF